MNAVDLAVLVVIALSAIFAFARGFVREALSIVAWFGAALITIYGFAYADGVIAHFVTTPLLAELIAGASLFLVALIFLTILTGYIARLAQVSTLSPIDRTLGLIFGVARGLVLVSLAYLVIDISLPQPDRPGWLQDARSEPFLAQGADMLRGMLPQSLQVRAASAVDDGQQALGQAQAAHAAIDALASPAAAPIPPKPADAAAPAYKPAEQRDLDRLIDNSR
ncbi:MAG TPA: CvpA family protein [Stellaceae bacterium]|jgi:membrane protein required for colicin V production